MRFVFLLSFLLSVAFAQDGLKTVYHTKMSDADVYVISLANLKPPIDKLIPNNNKDKKFIDKISKNIPQNNHNVMLIKHKNFVALIDVGFTHTYDALKTQLQNLGLKPNDITHLVITHAHSDHLGGILKDGKNNFPKAKMLIDEKEYDFWTKGSNNLAKETLLIFKNKKAFFDYSKPLFDSKLIIKSIQAYGHTPGHALISLEDGNDKLVFWADLMHVFSIQNERPDIAIEYDTDKVQATITRKKFLQELKGVRVIGSHLPFVEPIILR